MIALLLFFIFSIPQEPKIVTCTVVEPDKSVACPERGEMFLFSFDDANEAKQIFDEWRLVAPMQGGRANADAPLSTAPVKVGDKVKAIIVGNNFKPVAECNVRVWRRVKEHHKPGEIPSNMLFTLPADCQPGYGKQ